MILAIEMASRNFSLDEVLSLMEHEEDLEIDDPQEVILGGSDKEFDDIENPENCTVIFNYMYQCIIISCHVIWIVRHATLVISHLEDRRSPLVPLIDDIETGTVMFITLAITLKHFQELLTTQLIGEYKGRLTFPSKEAKHQL